MHLTDLTQPIQVKPGLDWVQHMWLIACLSSISYTAVVLQNCPIYTGI